MSEINSPSVLGFEIQTETFTVPSGYKVTVRETNGQDDAILSNLKNQEDQKALNRYLANIIVNVDDKGTVTPNDVLKFRVRDKYYILYRIRMLSLGDELHWNHDFKDGTVVPMIEDLKIYDWNYSEGNPPLKGKEDYNPLIATAYNPEPYVRFELSSNHIVQFNYMTGLEEKNVLGADESSLDINFRLTARKFKLFKDKDDEEGQFIENFQMFPSRIMAEIRARLETFDSEWTLESVVKHPRTGEQTTISLFSVPDFFFPGA